MSTSRLARLPAGSSAVKIDLHAPGPERIARVLGATGCARGRACRALRSGHTTLEDKLWGLGHPASAATGPQHPKKKKQDPSLHGPDDGVVPQVLVARPRRHGLL